MQSKFTSGGKSKKSKKTLTKNNNITAEQKDIQNLPYFSPKRILRESKLMQQRTTELCEINALFAQNKNVEEYTANLEHFKLKWYNV